MHSQDILHEKDSTNAFNIRYNFRFISLIIQKVFEHLKNSNMKKNAISNLIIISRLIFSLECPAFDLLLEHSHTHELHSKHAFYGTNSLANDKFSVVCERFSASNALFYNFKIHFKSDILDFYTRREKKRFFLFCVDSTLAYEEKRKKIMAAKDDALIKFVDVAVHSSATTSSSYFMSLLYGVSRCCSVSSAAFVVV